MINYIFGYLGVFCFGTVAGMLIERKITEKYIKILERRVLG